MAAEVELSGRGPGVAVRLDDQGVGRLGLEGTDVGRRAAGEAALIGGQAADGDAMADGGAAGEQGTVSVGPP